MSEIGSSLRADDGRLIPVRRWGAGDSPRAVIQVLHGLGEHAGRYERFARACNAAGISVVAHDHRGHGIRKDDPAHGLFADRNGWNRVLSDVLLVHESIVASARGVRLGLFGHSMGSYIAQSFTMRHPEHVDMLILSGSTFAKRSQLVAGNCLATILAMATGKRRKSKLLDDAGFGAFNRRFQPSRTDYDWLSRDTVEVDGYIADPQCGGRFTNQLWRDLTGGLLEITSPEAISQIPAKLPVLIFGGENDPVGGDVGLRKLAAVYRDTAHPDVTLKIYPGGRHEMLNETNRDDVTSNITEWIESRLPTNIAGDAQHS